MFEVVGEEVTCELRRAPNNEGGVIFTPRDYVICGGVVYELVGFGEEGGRH